MVSEVERYIDPGSALGAFCDEVYCQCPRCGKKAVTTAEIEYHVPLWFKNARIRCLSCAFRKDWSKGELYGAVVGTARQRCPNCGHKWLSAEVRGNAGGRLKEAQAVGCPHCKQRVSLPLRWHNEWRGSDPVDPYFGYPLWLQSECCGEILWAYNPRHLQTLKSYIGARLRDGRNRHKWAMTGRLPQWIKSAKNRGSILKCLERLEQRSLE